MARVSVRIESTADLRSGTFSGELDGESLAARYRRCRALTAKIASHLAPEDQVPQSMPDASPTKWHLAHTTWFFETFVLGPHLAGYEPLEPAYAYLFNSYYEAAGPRHPRPRRGLLTRPTVAEVSDYRRWVDNGMDRLLATASAGTLATISPLVELGIAHEEQHDELILMDVLHLFAQNTLRPVFSPFRAVGAGAAAPLEWTEFPGGIFEIGHTGHGFAFDCEGPRHEQLLRPFRLAHRAVTNGEWLEFMADGGYRRPELWLSDGWATATRDGWGAPLYWAQRDDGWHAMTLSGLQPVEEAAPVCHVSYYEADAYATWAGKRLPSEAELEIAAAGQHGDGAVNTLDTWLLRPAPARGEGVAQLFGDVWEWTRSPYVAYPGFRPVSGAVGEYNGKFMSSQMVLRGGCCATPAGHLRPTYRNFFYPHMRWMFAGLRLAEDA